MGGEMNTGKTGSVSKQQQVVADGKPRESPEQSDLLAPVSAETWLLNRLLEQGLDVYAAGVGDLPNLRDRLARVIADNRFGPVLAGRHNGKPETYEQVLLRVFDIKLTDVAKKAKAAAT